MITLLMTLIGDDPKEKERFKRFYYLYEQRAYRRAFSFMKNEQDALDVLQEAFISVAKNFSKVRDLESKETRNYVMTIVENKARKELKRNHKRHEAEEAMLESWELEAHKLRNEGCFAKMEIMDIISSMPDTYSDPMYLFYVLEKPVKEIAEHLGISSAAVRKRLERARSMLKEMIGEQYE